MRLSILKGIYTDVASDFRESYPRNMMPVAAQTGLSEGYLRPTDGIVPFGVGPGIDRGGINWNGICYRVMGSKLVSITSVGAYTVIGDVGGAGSGNVSMDYSFNLLAVSSNGRMYYTDGVTLYNTTDPDFGNVLDVLWVDGYFMFHNGSTIAVTELTDPFQVNPLKYGSSEVDPDPIKKIVKLRNEVHTINRYTIETFQNIGGSGFPFQRINGASVSRGAIGTYCSALYLDNIAFLGGGRNEPPAIWIADVGNAINISTREIDLTLRNYSEAQLSASVMEAKVSDAQKLLFLHLPDKTLVYDGAASQVSGSPVWHIRTTSIIGDSLYKARNFVWCYDKWICADPSSSSLGYFTDTLSSHYGQVNGWDFGTQIVYNEGNGAIFRELELVCLTGRVTPGVNPTIWTSYSTDGMSWSQEKPRTLGTTGETIKRINWYQQGYMRNWRVQKFRGTSDSHMSTALLNAKLEPLNG